jgi:hypothetical protein
MKRVALMVVFLSLLILNGCIVSTSPSDFIITMDKGDSLEFNVVVSPGTEKVQWTLYYGYYEGVEDSANGLHYIFTPDKVGTYRMKLEVTEPHRSTENRTWVIFVQ